MTTVMKIPPESQAIDQTLKRLSTVLDSRALKVVDPSQKSQIQCDAIVEVRKHIFALEWKRSGTLANVALAANMLRQQIGGSRRRMIPLLSVPFMGARGRKYCEETGVSWIDLSGNSSITGKNLYIRERGCKNQFRRRGPLASPFGAKGSRITRWMLAHPGERFRQRDLARDVGLNKGYTSRVVRKLLDSRLVTKSGSGIEVDDLDLLLDAWGEAYRFARHAVIRGHITARSGLSLMTDVADTLRIQELQYAMTGLPAAWLYTNYASFRLVTVYIESAPSEDLKDELGFREDTRGANTWFVVPNDEGVFHSGRTPGGVSCVHPVQAYLDLQGHPERSAEAAEELRYRFPDWSGVDE